jgi:hypothetical protein
MPREQMRPDQARHQPRQPDGHEKADDCSDRELGHAGEIQLALDQCVPHDAPQRRVRRDQQRGRPADQDHQRIYGVAAEPAEALDQRRRDGTGRSAEHGGYHECHADQAAGTGQVSQPQRREPLVAQPQQDTDHGQCHGQHEPDRERDSEQRIENQVQAQAPTSSTRLQARSRNGRS